MNKHIETQKNSKGGVRIRFEGGSKTNKKLIMAMKMIGFREISKFADHLGYTRTYASGIIHRHHKITMAQAQHISNKLNLTINDIFDLEDISDLGFVSGDKINNGDTNEKEI